MKNQLWILFSAMVMVVSSCAYAAENEDDASEASPNFYVGVGIGTFAFSEPSGYSVDDSKSRFATLGWEHKLNKGASVAIEYIHSFQANSNDSVSDDFLLVSSKYDFKSDALYGVYRTSGPLYFRVSGGIAHGSFTAKDFDYGKSKTDAALGLGFGLRGEGVYIEAGIMKAENDFSSASVGIGMHF